MNMPTESVAHESELLPCPFCGNAPNEWNYSFGGEPHWEIACCMARTGRKKSEARALDAWNRRAPPLQPTPTAQPDEKYEHVMKQWDYWRAEIAAGNTTSAPRDWFEGIVLSYFYPEPAQPTGDKS